MKRMGHGHLCCVLSSPQPPHHSPQPAAVEVLVAAMGAAHQRPQPAAVGVLVAAMGAAHQRPQPGVLVAAMGAAHQRPQPAGRGPCGCCSRGVQHGASSQVNTGCPHGPALRASP